VHIFKIHLNVLRTSKLITNKYLLEFNKNLFFCSVKHEGLFKSEYPIWPPFRIPKYDHPQMSNVQNILRSGVLHHFLLLCLNAVCF